MVRSLQLDNIIPLPTTPKRSLIWDADCKAPNLANAVLTLILNEILVSWKLVETLDFEKVTKVVKGEIIASITAYSNKNLSNLILQLESESQ